MPARQRQSDDAEQQAALRCAASVYNTGREQAGILNGYQADVWRAAAQVVPAIQFSAAGTLPSPPASRTGRRGDARTAPATARRWRTRSTRRRPFRMPAMA